MMTYLNDLVDFFHRLSTGERFTIAFVLFIAAFITPVVGNEMMKKIISLQKNWFILVFSIVAIVLLLSGATIVYWTFRDVPQ